MGLLHPILPFVHPTSQGKTSSSRKAGQSPKNAVAKQSVAVDRTIQSTPLPVLRWLLPQVVLDSEPTHPVFVAAKKHVQRRDSARGKLRTPAAIDNLHGFRVHVSQESRAPPPHAHPSNENPFRHIDRSTACDRVPAGATWSRAGHGSGPCFRRRSSRSHRWRRR